MANFSFTVDTHEMASALHEVAPHVDGATAAVVAMQSAVALAERQATEEICDNVNRGFFSLIRSQISQKIAACRSQVDARLLELRDQSQKLAYVKNSMQRDFQMITARYTKLFQSLDAALSSRIHEIDDLSLDLVQKDVKKMSRRSQSLQASVPMNQLESLKSSQLIAASSTKATAGVAIAAMSRFIADSKRQNLLTRSILRNRTEQNAGSTLLIPLALIELDSPRSRERQWQHRAPKMPSPALDTAINEAIERSVFTALQRMEWTPVGRESRERIGRRFNQLLEQSGLSERVRSHVARMYSSAQWASLTGVKS